MAAHDDPEVRAFFEAWYDAKREPADEELRSIFDARLAMLLERLRQESGREFVRHQVLQALSQAFGAWMREEGLPKPTDWRR